MLGKLFNFFNKANESSNQVPAIDLSFGYERLQEFKSYLQQSQYEAFEVAYDLLTWDAKTLLNEAIGLDANMATIIEKWVHERPDSYIANLFAGVAKTNLAWLARTASLGSQVSAKRAEQFFNYLEEAEQYLSKADKLNPDDAEICARMIRVYMGLGAEKDATYSYFDAAIAIQPNHLMTHLMMINYLNPKWRGSLEEMQHFAHERYQAAGSSLLLVLKLFAIVEEWLHYGMENNKEKERNFFKNPDLINELNSMYDAYREEEDGKLLITYVYNYFAFLFFHCDQKEKARNIIKKIDGQMTVYPWAYINIKSNKKLQEL